ncbi:MAG: cyclic pyranopterin monophosphate synthase MoaC [Syntrophobacteraceae bacterium]
MTGVGGEREEKPSELTHLDQQGRLRMVDVSDKDVTHREARASGTVVLLPETVRKIAEQSIAKGNVFEAARLAGIMAAKRTWELIPLCHPIQLTSVEIAFEIAKEGDRIRIASTVRTTDRTGVEMEALVAVTHAALTIYDMCKAVDRGMRIEEVQLTYKSGGKSGTYIRA